MIEKSPQNRYTSPLFSKRNLQTSGRLAADLCKEIIYLFH
ncbi:hypothetical protein HPS_0969 [Glaesserella parasuis 29755]|uniref:Uncharacterized protein n=1 Tax=Glaesserella parasuis serovar 5 (strain SH0165) TaxID=557723 RepID=B8F6H1_GLAP5|nr:hypothetical protein HAPS_1343 [Glaesserella parasuis SH0165]EQA01430.1 hypothetical protein HPSNAG_1318 [Glaesserella parasuis str. Nagasaki]EQA08512.1 hypothetical protein HPS8415995_1387 [Glaesserella parasuis 84-15995]EQA95505.1 hypothetical protein HPS_0969 [Glaesserella parasuis 29755]